ncbi:hypothetical protein L1987_85805 [Smallanthus sonchifolius]|uniref:Uncharacterized protein n=1 Tax=Smallanthus sonchifolius TaxID=185202 RepID=A0ACB8XZ57_9ASTR|nr:hypothetical protein L1987_85805 [Smallanthus sonchifolius]
MRLMMGEKMEAGLEFNGEVNLISTIVEKKSWTRPPIQIEFQLGFSRYERRACTIRLSESDKLNDLEDVDESLKVHCFFTPLTQYSFSSALYIVLSLHAYFLLVGDLDRNKWSFCGAAIGVTLLKARLNEGSIANVWRILHLSYLSLSLCCSMLLQKAPF